MALDADHRPLPEISSDVPTWLHRALADVPQRRTIDVAGAGIETLLWDRGAGPGILLFHGHGAHADWWRPTAPFLTQAAGRVVSFSLSGMGASAWRDHYELAGFADEAVAVAAATLGDPGRRPYLVAHSFGCLPAMMAADRMGDAISGLVLVDFYLPPPRRSSERAPPRQVRRYDSADAALARFRLSPEQECGTPGLLDFVARRTLVNVPSDTGEHWTWCTDPRTSIPIDHAASRETFASLRVPVTLVRGEQSRLVDRAIVDHQREIAPPGTRFVEIPEADHHVLLDQPLALAAAIRTLLG
jgi:pimeloyl-ACP methyl ester carboxylesterase